MPPRVSPKTAVSALFDAASAAQRGWAATPLADRCSVLLRFNELLLASAPRVSALISSEMGKPHAQALGEVRGCAARVAAQVADAPAALSPRVAFASAQLEERVEYEPIGVVANIGAWNYPLFTAANVFGAALLGGNAVLYKPSELTPRTGAALAELLHEAGVPAGAFGLVPAKRAAGAALASQPGLKLVAFTGSTAVGRRVAAAAAKTGARVALELGGKDAAYVTAGIRDVAATAAALADGAFYNTGQSCCSVERIYVHEDVAGAFISAFVAAVEDFKVGSPFEVGAYIGPLARGVPAASFLAAQVDDAVARGATIAFRGAVPSHLADAAAAAPPAAKRRPRGAPPPPPAVFFPPVVLTNVDHSMDVMRSESFGPVIGIQVVRSDGEAAALMNDSAYGLTAAVYGPDEAAATAILRSLDVGTGYWNACDRVSARVPWSGRRDSGQGVTLGVEGLRSFVQPKALHLIRPAALAKNI